MARPSCRPCCRGLGRRGLALLLAAASSGAAAAGADSAEELALALGGDELVPGTIVGQGRYVLAEKLGDVHHRPQQAVPHRHQARLPPPSDRLLLDRPEDTVGQLVPYEGLARAIASDLPQLPQLPSPTPQFLPAVFDYSVSFVREDPLFHEETWGYRFGQRLGKGSFGEAWRGVALDGSMREVVLKRLFVERGEHVRLSGEREIYFGSVLQSRPHVARFIESFEQQCHGRGAGGGRIPGHAHRDPSGRPPELWLVFHNEGFSLSHHLFRMQPGSMLVELSAFWWTVKRQQPVGGQVIKSLIYQLLHGVAVAHDMNFTHRDIKPSNVFVTDTWPPVVRLGDWGSALAKPVTEEFAKLYGKDGPTEGDETDGYQPPEVIFDSELLARTGLAKAGPWRDVAYDLWSLGVLLLELILGTREVFHVDERRWLRIEHSLRRQGVPTSRLGQARQLQAMLDLCLAPRSAPAGADVEWFFTPRPEEDEVKAEAEAEEEAKMSRPRAADVAPAGAASCSDEAFAEVLRRRDAAGVGLPSAAGRDLVRRLLEWSPEDRISARAALAHSWFDDGAQLPPLRSVVPVGGRRPRQLSAASLAGAGGEAGAPEEEDEEEEAEGSRSADSGPEETQLQRAPPYMAAGWRWAAEASCGKESSCGGSPDTETAEADGPAGSGALLSGCPGLWLHAAVHSDIGRRADMEDRYAVYNLSAPLGQSTEAIPGAGFLGVFDGHGGSAIAERLQRSLHQHFAADPSFPENVSTALKGAFATFDEMLLRERAKALGGLPVAAVEAGREVASRGGEDPGSTALVCVAAGCRLHLANLGDCRAVAALRAAAAGAAAEGSERPWPPGSRVEVRESPSAELRGQRGTIVEVRSASHKLYVVRLFRDGALRPLRQGSLRLLSELRAQRLTEDHKPGAEAERRRIEELGGEVEPPTGRGGLSRIRGLATSRSFGSLRARPFVSTRPDVREYSLDPERDVFIVLASDGVWDVLDDQLVVDLIWDQISSVHDSRLGPTAALEDAAQLIVQSALDRGALDNLTCAVLLFSWAACSGGGCEAKES